MAFREVTMLEPTEDGDTSRLGYTVVRLGVAIQGR
jgi:hypothetical protein